MVIQGQQPDVIQERRLLDIGGQQIRVDAHIVHHRRVSLLRPGTPGRLHPGQGFRLGADPGMVDVKAGLSSPEMEVDRCPVGQLRVVQPHNAAPPPQLRQRAVSGPHLLVVGNGDLLEARSQSHPLGEKIPVLLRVLQPVLVLVADFLKQLWLVRQGRVGHIPVLRVVYLLFSAQAADKGQEAPVGLPFEQDAAAPRQIVVQRAIAHLAVGGEYAHPRLGYLALAGDKDLDVIVVLKLVNLVKHHLARAHAVPALGVVGASLHDALVFPPLNELLGVVIVLFQFSLVAGGFQHLGQVLHRRHRLLLVVGADIHVIVPYRVIRGDGAGAVKRDQPVLAGAPAHHAQQGLPAGCPVRPVGTIPQGNQELLPGEQPLKGKILHQAQVTPKLLRIHPDVLLRKYSADIGREGVLLRAGPGGVRLHRLQIAQHLRRQATAHRPRPPGRVRP